MRAAYHLAFAVFSVGTVATPTTAPEATNHAGALLTVPQPHRLLDAVSIPADLSAQSRSQQDASVPVNVDQSASIGETLRDDIDLHPIPRHETYRYAVVNKHRVIVDAASRRIVYVVH
jgi:hypothetical protein